MIMSYMKTIYTEIELRYPNKKEELIDDFQQWNRGIYALPRTDELREILKDLKKGRI